MSIRSLSAWSIKKKDDIMFYDTCCIVFKMQSIIDEKKGKDTLQKFCSWSSERWYKAKRDRNREVFDVAVYLTKEDLGPAGKTTERRWLIKLLLLLICRFRSPSSSYRAMTLAFGGDGWASVVAILAVLTF